MHQQDHQMLLSMIADARIRKHVEDQQAEIERLKTAVDASQTIIRGLNSDKAYLRGEIERLRAETEELREHILHLEEPSEVAARDEEIERLRVALLVKEQDIEDYNRLELDNARLRADNAQWQDRCLRYQAGLESIEDCDACSSYFRARRALSLSVDTNPDSVYPRKDHP